jgi:hypothetical protein
MAYILLALSILFFVISFWLWRLSKVQTIDLVTRHPLRSKNEQEDRIYFTPLAKSKFKKVTQTLRIIIWVTISLIRKILPWLLLEGCIVGLVFLLGYFFRLDSYWTTIIATTLNIVVFLLLSTQHLVLSRHSASILIPWDEHTINYEGEVKLPKKVYVGDSQNISIDLQRVSKLLSVVEEAFSVHDKEGGKSIILRINQASDVEKFLEVELQAAALTIDGEKKQRHILKRPNLYKLVYLWNCYFPNSGNHAIILAFRAICASDVIELGVIQHTIKVVQLAHLTQRQVHILASISAIVAFIATIIGIILSIPSLLHVFNSH